MSAGPVHRPGGRDDRGGLTLHVDGDRWRGHLRAVHERRPGLVPVTKGNGYGFGLARLARRAQWLGVDTVACGTYAEAPQITSRFDGDVLVMTPWRFYSPPPVDPRLLHTVSRLTDLTDLTQPATRAEQPPRVVLELITSMRRHGLSPADLRTAVEAVTASGSARLAGVALHLPLTGVSHLPEVERRLSEVLAAGLVSTTVWVSHLTDSELATLTTRWPDLTLRARTGTELWLGDRDALSVRSRVLDVHPLARGEAFGYRGRSMPRTGTLLVVAGGTAHGIGLTAPTGSTRLRDRAASVARGGLEAAGYVRSPFTVDGAQRIFAEPPHMQVSMLWLPAGATPPAVGDEVEVRVRFTTTTFDEVSIS